MRIPLPRILCLHVILCYIHVSANNIPVWSKSIPKTLFSIKYFIIYTKIKLFICRQFRQSAGSVHSWRKEKRRRALLTTSKAQRSPPWSLSQWWPPATDHKMNTVLIQFPRGSVGKVEIAHA